MPGQPFDQKKQSGFCMSRATVQKVCVRRRRRFRSGAKRRRDQGFGPWRPEFDGILLETAGRPKLLRSTSATKRSIWAECTATFAGSVGSRSDPASWKTPARSSSGTDANSRVPLVESGRSALPAVRCRVENMHWHDFLDWRPDCVATA